MTEEENLARVRDYLAALAAGATGDALARFFTPDARQVELPNKLNPNGQASDFETLKKRSAQGRHVLREQRYDIVSAVAQGNRAAVEAGWTGVLAIPIGSLEAGDAMRAHFAMFFEFEDGRIRLERNYDCFEPF